MLISVTPAYRKRRGRVTRKASAPPPPPPPVALTLVSAVCDFENWPSLTLVFSRAINLAEVNPGVIVVDDGANFHFRYDASYSTAQLDPVTVQFLLTDLGQAVQEEGVHLTAASNNGIVAADDGTEWEGVANLELPFLTGE